MPEKPPLFEHSDKVGLVVAALTALAVAAYSIHDQGWSRTESSEDQKPAFLEETE